MIGGHFTAGLPTIATFRDKDIPTLLTDKDLPRVFGMIATDTALEQMPLLEGVMACENIAAINGLRFALAARPGKVTAVMSKLSSGEPVYVGTSYPRLVKELGKRIGADLQPKKVIAGQVEALANLMPEQLDAVVDMVDTGNSMRQQNLTIVADNLLAVSLWAVWPLETSDSIENQNK